VPDELDIASKSSSVRRSMTLSSSEQDKKKAKTNTKKTAK